MDRHGNRQTDGQTEKTGKHMEERHTDEQEEGQTYRWTGIKTNKQIDR
jgi:hypothetical protein